ncbi:hypothetical protein FRC09_007216 [Ceratobasidium sp. 395]|nr:hypothetical protein FRC09_007216 [Ceratobasidium sp. 395]
MSSTNMGQGDTGINALSLDGGSIASLMSSLELLEELMRRLQRELGLSDPPLPCSHFRLMTGAGFSGLGMSVQEARRHCVAIMDEAFSEKKAFGNEMFKITKLKAAVERMLELCDAGAGARMLDPRANEPETCKVMVCVAPESGMRAGMPARLRTYAVDANGIPDCTIIEAICSTFAVSGLFKPMDVVEPGDIKSIYVGLSGFNPMAWLLDEAANLFQNGRLKCAVSIGAGQKQASATECERVAEEMLVRFQNRPGHYFRLSVDQGMENIKTTDWEKRLEGTTYARSYLRVSENDAMMTGIVHAVLRKDQGVLTTHLRRDDLLNRVGRCLDNTQERRVCVIHGLGGAGKTQLALKFVEIHANDYDHVFYVDCTSRNTIDADLKRVALARKVGDCAGDALTWLARLHERWLIVYNNADDTSINLRGYFPSCSHGSILVTTRNRGLVNLACGAEANCPISNMSEDEAKELLVKASGLAEGVGAAGVTLVKMLGCFPLAIVQAGAYTQTNMCSMENYLEMYQKSRGEILEDYADEVQKLDDYELTVYATWQVSHRQLSPLARQLYGYLAFMHHDQIVEDIFRFAVLGLKDKHALPPTDEETRIEQTATEFLANFTRLADGFWDKAAFLQTVKDLTSYSLLTYDEMNRSYSIHPLVQQWTRTVVGDPGLACSCVAFLLASSVTWEYKTGDYAHRRVLLNHVDCLPESEKLRPRLAWRFQLVYKESGRTRDAERLAKAEYEANLRVLGQDHSYTLTAMVNLAETYWSQGRLGEAEVLQREAVEIRKRVSSDEDEETLRAMGNLALTNSSQGRWGEAEVLQREIVEVRQRVSGNEHPETLIQMGNLAHTYRRQGRQGRLEEAEALQREVVEVRKRVSGNEHPDTLIAIGNLAWTYSKQGRWGEAEALQREVVEVRQRVSGHEHPDTLIQMGNLAQTYSKQGRWGEAEALQREVVEVRKRVSGNEHPDTLIAIGNLAWTYSKQGWWGEAEALQREVVEVRQRVSGHEHPDTLIQMGNLAQTYSKQGRWGEAEALQREVVEVRKRVSGNEHPDTLIAIGNLAWTYSKQGRWGEAEALQREVVEVRQRVSGHEHPDTLIQMGNLAQTCSSQGRRTEAEVLLVEVVEVGKRVWGNRHPNFLTYTRHLDAVRSHLAQSNMLTAASSGEADNLELSLEPLHSDAVLEAATLDNVNLKPEGNASAAIHHWQLISWSVVVAIVCCFFCAVPSEWFLQILYRPS